MVLLLLKDQGDRGSDNVRMRERGLGEILITNLKTENKWKFPLTKGNVHKHLNN